MKIIFKEISFQNINSYGNSLTKFSFTPGLNAIVGLNRSGKTTILDALCFALYGTPFRKVKIKEIVNRVNKKGLRVSCKFNIDNDSFVITRTLAPDTIEILKNNSALNLLSSKRLTQEEINNLIGLDVSLFRQIIALAINVNRPFLGLTLQEKRELTDSLFNIKIFGSMLKSVKTANSIVRNNFEIESQSRKYLKENVQDSLKQLKSIENTKKNFERDKEKLLKKLKKELEELLKNFTKTESNIEKGILAINKYKEKIINVDKENLQKINQKLGTYSYRLKKLKTDIEFFNNNSVCPVCDSELSIEHKEKHLKDFSKEKLNIISNNEKLEKEKDKFENSLKLNKEIEEKILKIESAIFREKDRLKFYGREKETLEKRIEENFNKKFEIDVNESKTKLESKKEEYKNLQNKIQELKYEIKINDIMINILGDDGIKSHFFRKLIPLLNQKINEYLNKFEIPIRLTFDEFMQESISSFSGKYKDISYMTFSEGEKKRIDMAILLSFIEVTKLSNNFDTNLLIFDEILDSSTDQEGLEKIVDSIKNLLYKNSDQCIYIISHRDSETNFDNVYQIERRNGFSKIVRK